MRDDAKWTLVAAALVVLLATVALRAMSALSSWQQPKHECGAGGGERWAPVEAYDSGRAPVASGPALDARELALAAAFGDTETVNQLANRGADPNGRWVRGFTALHMAAFRANPDTARCLLKSGAEVNARNAGGATPLHCARAPESVAVARLLLEHGARVDSTDDLGRTPLHFAATRGDCELIEFLVAAGAQVDARTADGFTPEDLAAEAERPEAAELLHHYAAGALATARQQAGPSTPMEH